VVISMTG
jgi:hypothetical protein